MDVWHIVGNGPGELTVGDNERVIRFNQSLTLNASTNLTITNSKVAGLTNGVLVQGKMPDEQFTERLEANGKELESLLGCKPSLGLLAIKTMLEYEVAVNISCMALLPSLERPQSYSEKKALPAAYHNWLGERRLPLLWIGDLHWPEFLLQVPYQESASTAISADCFLQLQQMPTLPRKEARQLWEELSKVSYQTWLDQASCSNLKAVEPLFYISRNRHISPNWWIYDNQLSIHVNRLQKILAFVQQVFLFSERAKA
ncbi:hypothetical protein [Photobacterium lutimaris]|uniref:hypothetical protein n=1 Tax=Photobacterium lutimaris TaxID=388278 RepID=UPI00105F681E|nr:hypothetical protein [Photobacterium lutimaris]TDR69957.1 hypothetical protein DFP78_12511 [Photobacterium lutimaris]